MAGERIKTIPNTLRISDRLTIGCDIGPYKAGSVLIVTGMSGENGEVFCEQPAEKKRAPRNQPARVYGPLKHRKWA